MREMFEAAVQLPGALIKYADKKFQDAIDNYEETERERLESGKSNLVWFFVGGFIGLILVIFSAV